MNDLHWMMTALASLTWLAAVACAYEPDIRKFPADKATLPANLENMRPGQIRDAIAQSGVCLLPVGTLEPDGHDGVLGREEGECPPPVARAGREAQGRHRPAHLVRATGYIMGGPLDGTFDMPSALSRTTSRIP